MTARTLARRGIRKPTTVTSPYTGRVLVIVAAREVGCHVIVTTDEGLDVTVDAGQKVRQK